MVQVPGKNFSRISLNSWFMGKLYRTPSIRENPGYYLMAAFGFLLILNQVNQYGGFLSYGEKVSNLDNRSIPVEDLADNKERYQDANIVIKTRLGPVMNPDLQEKAEYRVYNKGNATDILVSKCPESSYNAEEAYIEGKLNLVTYESMNLPNISGSDMNYENFEGRDFEETEEAFIIDCSRLVNIY